jgi:hypothetical protein
MRSPWASAHLLFEPVADLIEHDGAHGEALELAVVAERAIRIVNQQVIDLGQYSS